MVQPLSVICVWAELCPWSQQRLKCNIQRSYASAWCPGLVSRGLRCIETSYLAQSMAASASPLGKPEAAHLPGKGCFQGRFFGWQV